MDYTPDACMSRFSPQQSLRMRSMMAAYQCDLMTNSVCSGDACFPTNGGGGSGGGGGGGGGNPTGSQPCINGEAGGRPCSGVAQIGFLSYASLADAAGGGCGGCGDSERLNDVWGWTNPATGWRVAVAGTGHSTVLVDVTAAPFSLGYVPQPSGVPNSLWKDVKCVSSGVAYVVSEASGFGLQVIDLAALEGETDAAVRPATRFTGFGSAHNLIVNELETRAYAVGVSGCQLYAMDIATDPLLPRSAGGCIISGEGYIHDGQCVIWADAPYQGHEVCLLATGNNAAANGGAGAALLIMDMGVPGSGAAPVRLSRVGYSGSRYSHQGWLSPDRTQFFLGDDVIK